MTEHDPLDEIEITTDEGTVGTMQEIQCGGRYTLVDEYATYCPLCGEQL